MKVNSFSNRVAFSFMSSTAVLTIAVFLTIYWVVFHSVYTHLTDDLNAESSELFNSIVVLSDQVVFANPDEWLENEHGQIEVNPTFIQFADSSGIVTKKSANLLNSSLNIRMGVTERKIFEDNLGGARIYQLQVPVMNTGGILFGYLSVAVPLDDTLMVLRNLRLVLLIAFPVAILFLYLISDLIARKNIAPVFQLTDSARKISDLNSIEKIRLPERKDELYQLTEAINNLLGRLQDAALREKQFTSDASHELRTPLSVLRGSFELTLRKKRDEEYYLQKIREGLKETDRMSHLVDQLLLLARYEDHNNTLIKSNFNLHELVLEQLPYLNEEIEARSLDLQMEVPENLEVYSERFMLGRIIENLLSNAIKYSNKNGQIKISAREENGNTMLIISDNGIGMEPDDLSRIFERFYRADQSRNFRVPGNGLGLAIVKRFSDLLAIKLNIISEKGTGTVAELLIHQEMVPDLSIS